jgi:hypothetical protein
LFQRNKKSSANGDAEIAEKLNKGLLDRADKLAVKICEAEVIKASAFIFL